MPTTKSQCICQNQLVLASKMLDDCSERSTVSVSDAWLANAGSGRKVRSKNSSRRRVKFNLQANSHCEHTSRDELSQQDMVERWYNQDDFKMMKSKQRIALRMMKTGRFDDKDSDDFSYRGIDTESDKTKRRELQTKIHLELLWAPIEDYFFQPLATDTVVKIQEITENSVQAAILRARQDQEAALLVYRD